MKIALDVLRIELLQLARDKRALFSAIVLPALLYPLFFFGSGKLESVGRETMAEREVNAALDLTGIDEADRDTFLAEFTDRGPVALEMIDAGAVLAAAPGEERRLAARALLGLDDADEEESPANEASADDSKTEGGPFTGEPSTGEAERGETDEGSAALDGPASALPDLLIIATHDGEPAATRRTTFTLWYDVKSDDAREGVDRARGSLRSIESTLATERRENLLGGDPGRGLSDPLEEDLATVEDTSGAALGRWLPFVALLVLISGGAYAALAVFAGEREAGTLETLLVQPVPHQSIAMGKFLAVFVAGSATLIVNLGSLVACVAFGLADMDAFGGASGGVGIGRLATLIVELPACLLLCAVLCLVCGGARTFREGQMLVFPVTLLAVIPTSIVLRPEAALSAFWAMVPFSGSALALRDGLEGDLNLPLAALVVVSHLGWTWLALTRLAGVLDGEKVLGGGGDAKAESHLRKASGRHAMGWGFAVVMTVYLIAGSVQRWDLDVGLWFTFWFLLPVFAVLIARTAPRAEGDTSTLRERLGLTLPNPLHVLGALMLVPALAKGATYLFTWQSEVLPLPQGAGETGLEVAFMDNGPLWLFFFFSLSPGLFEELVFRGSLLSAMRRDWTWKKCVLWQAIYFALVHASIYRLLPTGILGGLLALITLRARSLFPAIALHMGYNGLLVLGQGEDGGHLPFIAEPWFEYAPWLAIPGVLFLVIGRPWPSER